MGSILRIHPSIDVANQVIFELSPKQTIMPPHIILSLFKHLEKQKTENKAKTLGVSAHHRLLQAHLKDIFKKKSESKDISITPEQIEEIKKIITDVIAFIKELNLFGESKGKKIDTEKHSLNLDEISLESLSLPEIKTLLENHIKALSERITHLSEKRVELKSSLAATKKQLDFDADHFIFGNRNHPILDKVGEFADHVKERVGEILHQGNPGEQPAQLHPQFPARVFDAKNKSRLPPAAKNKVFDNSVDPDNKAPALGEAVNFAYQNTEKVLNFWHNIFGIKFDQVDGMKPGQPADSVIHFMRQYVNAFFDGKEMVYGDGNKYFRAFYYFLMIAGHEMGHALVGNALNYQDQSGALNESYADIFGACTDMFSTGTSVKDYSWLVGDGLVVYKGNTYPLRTFKEGPAYVNIAPLGGTDPQPNTMSAGELSQLDPDMMAQDNGGVHILSKIPNRVFYMVAMAQNDWKEPVLFWKRVMDNITNPDITFADFAALQITMATTEGNFALVEQLIHAWGVVKVTPTPSLILTEIETRIPELELV